jgi:hypothetical protein
MDFSSKFSILFRWIENFNKAENIEFPISQKKLLEKLAFQQVSKRLPQKST